MHIIKCETHTNPFINIKVSFSLIWMNAIFFGRANLWMCNHVCLNSFRSDKYVMDFRFLNHILCDTISFGVLQSGLVGCECEDSNMKLSWVEKLPVEIGDSTETQLSLDESDSNWTNSLSLDSFFRDARVHKSKILHF